MSTPVTSNEPPLVQKGAGKKRRANYAALHKDALPLTIHPLPLFHPTQPLSLLYLVWTYLQQITTRPSSHAKLPYIGVYSSETRSVHVTNPVHVRGLWERGFFGKGVLSRSEPTWLTRAQTQLHAAKNEPHKAAEDHTRARREERRLFKLERARAEREKIENQKLVEQGIKIDTITTDSVPKIDELAELNALATSDTKGPVEIKGVSSTFQPVAQSLDTARILSHEIDEIIDISNQEHLQLTLEEAFFLRYALGVLDIRFDHESSTKSSDLSSKYWFNLFKTSAKFVSAASATGLDDQFTLNYVVYHHFRSLGWVVRSGVKFSVDYLLYNRGPVFSHAEFAVLIMPTYSHQYWSTEQGRALRRVQDQKDWWWLHCINRVQSQVLKTLVLCYVDVPPPSQPDEHDLGVTDLLKRYKVREFVLRRWLMNRSRD